MGIINPFGEQNTVLACRKNTYSSTSIKMIYTLGTKLHFNVGKVIIDKMIENHIIEQMYKRIEKERIVAFERSLVLNQNQREGKLCEESEKLMESEPNEEGKVVERKVYEDGKKNEKNEANACGDNQTGDNLPADNLTRNILPGHNLTGDNLPDNDLPAVNLTGIIYLLTIYLLTI